MARRCCSRSAAAWRWNRCLPPCRRTSPRTCGRRGCWRPARGWWTWRATTGLTTWSRPRMRGRLRCWPRRCRPGRQAPASAAERQPRAAAPVHPLHTAATPQPVTLPQPRRETAAMKLLRNVLLWIVLAAIGALLAWMALGADHGQVLVRYGGYDYTATLVNVIAVGLAIALALWLAWWLLSLPFRTWHRRRDEQARASLGDGLEALHQGRYAQADKLLGQAVQDPHGEAAARVAVAHAAYERGDLARARSELDAFGERHPATRAIAIAELALADGRPTDALVALDAPAAQPLPPRGLALRAEALGPPREAAPGYGPPG